MVAGKAQDELDNKSIDQLHEVVLQLSSNCFELKKLCATLVVAASTLIITFAEKVSPIQISTPKAIILIDLLIVVLFWILDSLSFYYQQKLRLRMRDKAQEIVNRSLNVPTQVDGVGMPADTNIGKSIFDISIKALFNRSMTFYFLVSVLVFLAIVLL